MALPSLLDDPLAPQATSLLPGVPALTIAPPDPNQPDVGTGLSDLYNSVTAELARQRQQSRDMGLWTGGGLLEGGHPTMAGVADAGNQFVTSLLMGSTAPGESGIPGLGDRISTRIPTAKGLNVDPHATADLQIGTDSIAGTTAEPKVAARLQSYPDVPTPQGDNAQGVFDAAIGHFKDNMRWIYDNMIPEVRDIAKNWYDGANSMTADLADQYGISHRSVAGLTARLSPGTDWYQNYSMAKRILDINANSQDALPTDAMNGLMQKYIAQQKIPEAASDMQAAFDRIQTTPYGQLGDNLDRAMWIRAADEAKTAADPSNGTYNVIHPNGYEMGPALTKKGAPETLGWQSLENIGKGLSMLDDDSLGNISTQLGGNHKIRSFYNNIISPNAGDDVTIDTHQVGAAHLLPLGPSDPVVSAGMLGPPTTAETGAKGLYGIYADATRQLAQELNLLPRQVQSITWEGLRSLFPSELKRSPSFVQGIRNLWSNSTDAAATRDAIGAKRFDQSGRIAAPDWFTSGP